MKGRTLAALPLALLLASVALAEVRVDESTAYPSPMGEYDALSVSRLLETGVPADAPATSGTPPDDTQTPNPANAAQSSIVVNGNAYIMPLDANLTIGATNYNLREVRLEETMTIGGNALKTRSLWWPSYENHFIGIGVPGDPQNELHVNGDLRAHRIRASRQFSTGATEAETDNDLLLFFGISDDGNWAELGARRGGETPVADGWDHPESIARFRASPNIILNGYSGSNVGIGTTNPQYLLQVGTASSGLTAISHSWQTYSSRAFKTDIRPLVAADVSRLAGEAWNLSVVRYRYKGDPDGSRLRTGVVAEEAPAEILSADKKAMSLSDTVAFLFAAIRELKQENDRLEKEVARLERDASRRAPR